MFERPGDFGLAVHREQLPVRSSIPPCDESFDYCIYYLGETFAGTNFQSAGVRIESRLDLETETACLLTPPKGYFEFDPIVRREEGFAVSIFAPIQTAGMGHAAVGELLRLALDGRSCFEVESRIAISQLVHY